MDYVKVFGFIAFLTLSVFGDLQAQIDSIYRTRKNSVNISYNNHYTIYRKEFKNYPPGISSANKVLWGDSSYIYNMPRGFSAGLERSFFPKKATRKMFFSAAINYTFDHASSVIYVTSRVNNNGSRIVKETYDRSELWTSVRLNYVYRKWLATIGVNVLTVSKQSSKQNYLDGSSTQNLRQDYRVKHNQIFLSLLAPISTKNRIFIRTSASSVSQEKMILSLGFEWAIANR